jgi:hypothetical protein
MQVPGPLPEGAMLVRPAQGFTTEELAEKVREARNLKLTATQWIIDRHSEQLTAGTATTLSESEYLDWLIYRQNLRDLPVQPGFPWNGPTDENCPWPVKPV